MRPSGNAGRPRPLRSYSHTTVAPGANQPATSPGSSAAFHGLAGLALPQRHAWCERKLTDLFTQETDHGGLLLDQRCSRGAAAERLDR